MVMIFLGFWSVEWAHWMTDCDRSLIRPGCTLPSSVTSRDQPEKNLPRIELEKSHICFKQNDDEDEEDERLYRAYMEQQEAMLRQQQMQEAYMRQQYEETRGGRSSDSEASYSSD